MSAELECENCGGTDFFREAGYFYCNECQIQSQQVQVQEFQIESIAKKKTVAVVQKEAASAKDHNKITSWECYNYILRGLTQELLELGAQPSFKTVMRILWMRYLEKLQVFSLEKDDLPKLQAVNSRVDGEIIYGKLKRGKRKYARSSSDESASSTKGNLARQKRVLGKKHYTELSQKSQDQQGSSSLHNETLTSLRTSSDKSSRKTAVSFNYYARKELRKNQGVYHLKKHNKDFECKLKCHKATYRTVSRSYQYSPHILSLNKLYALLYLGLLINHDKIQLGDLLRFIHEGELSFNYYDHFFPEDFRDKNVNFKNFKKNSIFSNSKLRNTTAQLAEFLNAKAYINIPNILELTQRYCVELNLPQEVYKYCEILHKNVQVKMKLVRSKSEIPNYEGRVLSVILFVLKLLFGFDDRTEFELSKFGSILNQSKSIKTKCFNVVEWLKYLEYRKIVLNRHCYLANFGIDNLDLYTDFVSRGKNLPEPKSHPERERYSYLLNVMKSKAHENGPAIVFKPSFTPFRSYLEILLDRGVLSEKYLHDILNHDFKESSLDFILRPDKFIAALSKNGKVKSVNGGANENWIFSKISSRNEDNKDEIKKRRELVLVELTTTHDNKSPLENVQENSDDYYDEEKAKNFKTEFHSCNKAIYTSNRDKTKRLGKNVRLNVEKVAEELAEFQGSYPEHFLPHERFWVRGCVDLPSFTHKSFDRFFEKFPSNFKLILKECARIAQQTEQEFFEEYQLTEIYLTYVFNDCKIRRRDKEKTALVTKSLQKLIDKACEFW